MDVHALLPGTEALVSEGVSIEPGQVVIRVSSVQPRARCPDCQQPAHRVHSGYDRTLADLPMPGTPVRLHMWLRRFFCDNDRCVRRTFVERLPEVSGVRLTVAELAARGGDIRDYGGSWVRTT